MTSNLVCQLWMGCVQPYMTESFILSAFQKMGENPLSVKIMKNKYTTEGKEEMQYCFVHFQTEEETKAVMLKLNGKYIPNTVPPIRFRLNSANPSKAVTEKDYSVWVGNLSADVDEYNFYKTFASRYSTIQQAKVVVDSTGYSKGFGFLKFGSEEEQRHCLNHMNALKGLGTKPLKISSATPKLYQASTTCRSSLSAIGSYGSSPDFSSFGYEQVYWQNYLLWQNYFENPSHNSLAAELPAQNILDTSVQKEDELELIEHNTKVDIDNWNREMIQRDYNLWDALESSKWMPLDISD